MSDNLISDYEKLIFKPINQSNGNNTCWINSALYLICSHPYIFFQYMLLDNKKLLNYKIKINNDIYMLIINNYKYIKSYENSKSNIVFDQKIYSKLFDIYKKYNLINLPENITMQWDAIDIIDNLLNILTKTYTLSHKNENCYLSYGDSKILRKKKDFYDMIYKNNLMLIGFVLSQSCIPMNNYEAIDETNIGHWISFIRKDLNKKIEKKDIEWYMFDALNNKMILKKTSDIYNCQDANSNAKMIYCIYIDMEQFKKIISKDNNLDNLKNFIDITKREVLTKEKNENTKEKIKELEINISSKNKNNINLLTIKELEILHKKNIDREYYNNIYDKRAYIINLLN